ncbi:hypothetical protein M413DRAFT_31193 [Hebeloma cylindrosporum]|uniref:Uncharacterized protein n=1 Tax=Hebeloma cylindrosporum TaxID=76867 RepID=A0A0C3BJW5_HEBCY|nr:hypothetical protein M413DRAFT_31193 [Hebeloma cylindrosporum h7]
MNNERADRISPGSFCTRDDRLKFVQSFVSSQRERAFPIRQCFSNAFTTKTSGVYVELQRLKLLLFATSAQAALPLVMDTPYDALFGAPSTIHRHREPRTDQKLIDTEGINPYKILVITLSLFLFAGFLWLCVCPFIFKSKQSVHIDPENAYFLDKDEKRPSPFSYERKPPPYSYRYGHYRSMSAKSASPGMTTQWLKAQNAWATTAEDSVTTPPPSYRSGSTRSTQSSAMDTSTLSSFIYTTRSAYKATQKRALRKSTIPSIKITRSSTVLSISHPIPHPDGPLPGPQLDMEVNDGSGTTFLHPEATSGDTESPTSTTYSPPPVYLPIPCTAVVHENNNTNITPARTEASHDNHDRATSTTTSGRRSYVTSTLPDDPDSNPRLSFSGRFSQFFVGWDDSVSSIASSDIGIAI